MSISKANYSVLIVFTILVILCSLGQSALSFYVFQKIALFTVLYQGIRCVFLWRSVKGIVGRLINIAIILTLLFLLWVIKVYQDDNAQEKSNQVATSIENFYLNNHRYPSSFDELGINSATVRDEFRLYYFYHKNERTPALMRESALEIGDYWLYQFSSNKWIYVSP